MCYVKLNLISRKSQSRIQLLEDKSKFDFKLLPKLFIDLRNLTLIISNSATWLELLEPFLAFEAWLSKSLFPGVKIDPQDWYLIVSDHQQLLSDIPQDEAVHLILIELSLQGLQRWSYSVHFVHWLLVYGGYQGLFFQRNQHFEASFIKWDWFLEEPIDFTGNAGFREGFIVLDVLLQNVGEVTKVLQLLQISIDGVQLLDLSAFDCKSWINLFG